MLVCDDAVYFRMNPFRSTFNLSRHPQLLCPYLSALSQREVYIPMFATLLLPFRSFTGFLFYERKHPQLSVLFKEILLHNSSICGVGFLINSAIQRLRCLFTSFQEAVRNTDGPSTFSQRQISKNLVWCKFDNPLDVEFSVSSL